MLRQSQQIKAIRQAKKLSQEKFGKEIFVSKSHVCNAEKDKDSLSDAVIDALKNKFNVNPTWWETGEGEMFNQAVTVSEKPTEYMITEEKIKSLGLNAKDERLLIEALKGSEEDRPERLKRMTAENLDNEQGITKRVMKSAS